MFQNLLVQILKSTNKIIKELLTMNIYTETLQFLRQRQWAYVWSFDNIFKNIKRMDNLHPSNSTDDIKLEEKVRAIRAVIAALIYFGKEIIHI